MGTRACDWARAGPTRLPCSKPCGMWLGKESVPLSAPTVSVSSNLSERPTLEVFNSPLFCALDSKIKNSFITRSCSAGLRSDQLFVPATRARPCRLSNLSVTSIDRLHKTCTDRHPGWETKSERVSCRKMHAGVCAARSRNGRGAITLSFFSRFWGALVADTEWQFQVIDQIKAYLTPSCCWPGLCLSFAQLCSASRESENVQQREGAAAGWVDAIGRLLTWKPQSVLYGWTQRGGWCLSVWLYVWRHYY